MGSARPLWEVAPRVRASDITAVSRSSPPPPVEHFRDDSALEVAAPISPKPTSRTLRLNKAERAILNVLWLKLQRRVDFPVFAQTARALGRRADFEEADTGSELGESILKDGALTVKLLRIINSAYASRFGGVVDSVHHAIVILGSDRVRSIALSISLFENQGSDAQTLRVSESAIGALISGEIAQQFAAYAQVSDAEQAMICGMFRNLGRHLAIVYFPEAFDQILVLARTEMVNPEIASERILGLSFRKLGLGVAERWGLPKPILGVMSNVPGLSGRWAHEEDRMVALAEFSNELCEIVATVSAKERPLAIANLLLRHKALVTIDADTMAELLLSVEESFDRRYSSLHGLDSTKSSFSRKVDDLEPGPASAVRSADHQSLDTIAEAT
jgi:HD-like signal output (HDOD) protein